MNEVRASVAMAVYNGEQYICEQIDSILEQLQENDELVISYDRSTDNTKTIIDDYARKDTRVHVVENNCPGVQNNFNNAVMACRGKYIFLSDQDDVWLAGKVDKVIAEFERTDADLVVHDGWIGDANLNKTGKTLDQISGTHTGCISNIIKGTYWGCCMAFRSELREIVNPFPSKNAVGHDIWLGILAGFYGKVLRIPDCLIIHRLHSSNVTVTKRRKLNVILLHRVTLITGLCHRIWTYKSKAGRKGSYRKVVQ